MFRGKPANTKSKVLAATWALTIATVLSALTALFMSLSIVHFNGLRIKALFNSGSSKSFILPRIEKEAALAVYPLSPSRREAPCEGTNSAGRFITPGYFDRTFRNPKLSKFYVMDVGLSMVMAVIRMQKICASEDW